MTYYSVDYTVGLIFEGVQSALRNLEEGRADNAIRALQQIQPHVANLEIRLGDAAVTSPLFREALAVCQKFEQTKNAKAQGDCEDAEAQNGN